MSPSYIAEVAVMRFEEWVFKEGKRDIAVFKFESVCQPHPNFLKVF